MFNVQFTTVPFISWSDELSLYFVIFNCGFPIKETFVFMLQKH